MEETKRMGVRDLDLLGRNEDEAHEGDYESGWVRTKGLYARDWEG